MNFLDELLKISDKRYKYVFISLFVLATGYIIISGIKRGDSIWIMFAEFVLINLVLLFCKICINGLSQPVKPVDLFGKMKYVPSEIRENAELYYSKYKNNPNALRELVDEECRHYSKEPQQPHNYRFGKIYYTALKNEIGYICQSVPSEERYYLKDLLQEYGFNNDLFFSKWVIDRQKQQFLLNLYGAGYRDKDYIGVFVFKSKDYFARLEANYVVEKTSEDKCIIHWKISKIQMLIRYKDAAEKIKPALNEAFLKFEIDLKIIVEAVNIDYNCDIEFKNHFSDDEAIFEKIKQERNDKIKKDIEYIKAREEDEQLSKLSAKDKVLYKIKDLNFEDSIFYITVHNDETNKNIFRAEHNISSNATCSKNDLIDAHEYFNEKSHNEIEDWTSHSKQLLKAADKAPCDYYMSYISDDSYYEIYKKELIKLMNFYPGFSERVYENAVSENARYGR